MVSVSSFVNIWDVSEIKMTYGMKKTNNKLNELNMFFSKFGEEYSARLKKILVGLAWRKTIANAHYLENLIC